MAEHAGMATSLRSYQEAEQKNPQIAASFPSRGKLLEMSEQVSALARDTTLVQQFSVGSPRPFAGLQQQRFRPTSGSASSQDIPYPGKRQLRARVAEHGADSMEAQTDRCAELWWETSKMVYFRLAYIQQTPRPFFKK